MTARVAAQRQLGTLPRVRPRPFRVTPPWGSDLDRQGVPSTLWPQTGPQLAGLRFSCAPTECSREHGEFFVSIISSHGEEGAVFGSDCRPLQLTRIFRILSPQNCPVLAERPKVFFIQVTQLLVIT